MITCVDFAGWDSHSSSADDQKKVRMTQLGHRWALVGGFLELETGRPVAVQIRGVDLHRRVSSSKAWLNQLERGIGNVSGEELLL